MILCDFTEIQVLWISTKSHRINQCDLWCDFSRPLCHPGLKINSVSIHPIKNKIENNFGDIIYGRLEFCLTLQQVDPFESLRIRHHLKWFRKLVWKTPRGFCVGEMFCSRWDLPLILHYLLFLPPSRKDSLLVNEWIKSNFFYWLNNDRWWHWY